MASNTGQPLYLLSEQDLATLRQLIERERRRPQNQPGPSEALSEDNERSVVFAYIPVGGIPARADAAAGMGTGTGSGTAALNVGDYTLYGVECQMYREEWDDLVTTPLGSGTSSADAIRATARRVLKAVEGWTELVFNPDSTALSGEQLVPTTISPWGSRVPLGLGSGTTTEVIGFRVLSAGPYVYSDLPECADSLKVTAEVTEVACGVTGVSVGDRVVIYDPRHCKFDLPIEVLLGALGTAVKMVNTMTTDYGVVVPGCAEYEELVELACRWVVTDLSCCEECYACD